VVNLGGSVVVVVAADRHLADESVFGFRLSRRWILCWWPAGAFRPLMRWICRRTGCVIAAVQARHVHRDESYGVGNPAAGMPGERINNQEKMNQTVTRTGCRPRSSLSPLDRFDGGC
jgi:hypothetical protein